MFMCYEDLMEDLVGGVRRLAEFANIVPKADEAEAIYAAVYARSKPEYMRAHLTKFDDHSMNRYMR